MTAKLPPLDRKATRAAETLLAAMPGRGEGLGQAGPALVRWAAVRGQPRPVAQRPTLTLFAATHGGHRADPKREADVLAALAAGGMPVNFACGEAGVGLRAFELALDHPTPDVREKDALSERDCAATIAFGMEALAEGPDVVLLSHTQSPGAAWAGLCVFAALDPEGEAHWRASDPDIDRAFGRLGRARDPLEALRRFGGRDTAAMVGAVLAARAQKALVILDGWGAAAAYRVCQALDREAVSHCVFADGERRLALPNALFPPGVPIVDCPKIRCAAADDAGGIAAVAAFVQLKTAAAIMAKAPTAKQLGLDA